MGDVLDPEGSVIGIGSGGNYALSAAKALLDTDLTAEEIALKSLKICLLYTSPSPRDRG